MRPHHGPYPTLVQSGMNMENQTKIQKHFITRMNIKEKIGLHINFFSQFQRKTLK
jgi:hypothetical protein